MCEAKTNHVSLVSPDLNRIEQLLDELWRCIRDRSVQPWSFRQLHGMGVDFQKRCVASHVLVRPRYEAVVAAGEGRVHFLHEFNSSELI